MGSSIRLVTSAVLLVGFAATACEAHVDVLEPSQAALRDAAPAPDARVAASDASPPRKDSGAPVPHDAAKPPDRAVADLQASFQDTCAIAAGTLYCWGLRADGTQVLTPARVEGSAAGAYRHVSGGAAAHCTTRTSGRVFCFGANDRGELGQGDRVTRPSPALVSQPATAESVSGKFDVFCSRLVDGRLMCWGQNDEGQMGQSDTGTPVDALIPVRVESASDWRGVGTGQGHVCGIRSPGSLYCWGRNTDGELGQGPNAAIQIRTPTLVAGASDWTTVVAGQVHTCGLRGPGQLYCFGDDSSGQLGVEPRAGSNAPIRIGDGDDWRTIATDTFHSCGVRATGTLWCWGRNAEGQLGLGDTTDRDVPTRVGEDSDWADVSVGRFHTCARRTDGTAWCTGANDGGQLGTGDTDRRNVLAPVVWGPG